MDKKIIKTRRVAQVVFKNAQVLDITGPMEVFAQANEILYQSHQPGPAIRFQRNIKDTLMWMSQNPDQDLSIDALALGCAMSQRNFTRIFKKEVGMTPGKYVEKMRVEYAALLIETQEEGFKAIAQTSGFRSEEMMRRAFKRQLNVLPHLYRKHFGK